MRPMTEEITATREAFRGYILDKDIPLQEAAELVGWKRAGSVHKFLAGKHVPTPRRLYKIKKLVLRARKGRA